MSAGRFLHGTTARSRRPALLLSAALVALFVLGSAFPQFYGALPHERPYVVFTPPPRHSAAYLWGTLAFVLRPLAEKPHLVSDTPSMPEAPERAAGLSTARESPALPAAPGFALAGLALMGTLLPVPAPPVQTCDRDSLDPPPRPRA